jgi:aminopeptidase
MTDTRISQYARLLVEDCIGVQEGWQVIVSSSPLARPLVEAVTRLIAAKRAYAIMRISLTGSGSTHDFEWATAAPLDVLSELAPIERHAFDEADGLIVIEAPENTRVRANYEPARFEALMKAGRPIMERQVKREIAWVGCQYPTPALAQDAGMSTPDFADFLFGACLRDWDEERARMQRYATRFDGAEQVRIVGDGTDLTLGIAGREFKVDAGGANIPGGEFFSSPVEDTAEGVIHFSEFPAPWAGRDIKGIRLRFEGGRVVDASSESEEELLFSQLDTDDGARRLGELGIGCNPGITKYMRNTLFDEKIDGTVHLALGAGIQEVGGTNQSSIHWDIVKDLRNGGRLELDGEVVQENGEWLIARS